MAQYEVIHFLKLKYDESKRAWFTTRDIARGLKEMGYEASDFEGFARRGICRGLSGRKPLIKRKWKNCVPVYQYTD
jgi:hypothetical protein